MKRIVAPHLTPRAHKQPAACLEQFAASAVRIADRAVIADIECEGVRVGPPGGRHYDLRPWLDEREHAPECVDMASEALAYAIARGLVVAADPAMPWLVRVVVTAP